MNPNQALVDSWQLSLHHKSDKTRVHYRRTLDYFLSWLATHQDTPDLLTVTRQDCEAYFGSLQQLSGNTRRSRWIGLRSFYGWLVDEEELERSPMAKVVVPRPQEPAPPVLSADQVKRLLRACQGATFRDRRDTAIARALLATGMRLGECTALELGDVDLHARVMVVRRGKGGKRRVVRFDAATANAIDRYLRYRARHRHSHRSGLWLGARGVMTESGIDRALSTRARVAGIDDFHAHLLRHTWADAWKSAGGSDESLATLGGWSDPRTMARYGESRALDRALAAYDNLGVMDRF